MWSNGLFEQLYMSLSPLCLRPAPTSLLSASAQLYVCYTDAFSGHPHPITWPLPSKDKLGDEDFFYVKLNKVPILPWKPSRQVDWKEVKNTWKGTLQIEGSVPSRTFSYYSSVVHGPVRPFPGLWNGVLEAELSYVNKHNISPEEVFFFFFQLYFLFCWSVFSIFLEPNFLQF